MKYGSLFSGNAGPTVAGTLAGGAHPGSYNGRPATSGNLIANTLGAHHDGAPIVYTIQTNDGGSHKRADRPKGGMYVNEADTALTVESTDQTVVAFAHAQSASSDRSYIARAGDYAGSLGATKRDAIASPQIGVRRLTPTECERLQGFPDGWTADLSDSQRYKALGNAVAVPCTEWLGRRILDLSD